MFTQVCWTSLLVKTTFLSFVPCLLRSKVIGQRLEKVFKWLEIQNNMISLEFWRCSWSTNKRIFTRSVNEISERFSFLKRLSLTFTTMKCLHHALILKYIHIYTMFTDNLDPFFYRTDTRRSFRLAWRKKSQTNLHWKATSSTSTTATTATIETTASTVTVVPANAIMFTDTDKLRVRASFHWVTYQRSTAWLAAPCAYCGVVVVLFFVVIVFCFFGCCCCRIN